MFTTVLKEKMNRECHVCHGSGIKMCCSRCISVYYCGRECQQADWDRHRRYCSFDPDAICERICSAILLLSAESRASLLRKYNELGGKDALCISFQTQEDIVAFEYGKCLNHLSTLPTGACDPATHLPVAICLGQPNTSQFRSRLFALGKTAEQKPFRM